jgi:hypothetical protein
MKVRRILSPALLCKAGCALFAASLFFLAPTAHARKRGFAVDTCEGCHGPRINSSLEAGPLSATPGETVTFQVVLSDSDAKVGGIYIQTDDVAGVSIPGGQTIVVVGDGVTHTNPVPLSNGSATFSLTYRVPSAPGATRFSVWAVAANQNDDDTGDEVVQSEFSIVYGCESQMFYADLDGDGHGRDLPTRTACAGVPPDGFAPAPDDCDDNDGTKNPSATELCNEIDDNCNGEVDEGAVPMELFPDADGDGYYSNAEWRSGDSVIGCVPYPGYADKPGDCEPNAANAHPGGVEVCDLRVDEDCDGSVDERVKPYCGVGACERQSRYCTVEECVPGEPTEEVCNFLDDDCDGELDEGDLCPAGQQCLAGSCRDAGAIIPPTPGTEGGTGGVPVSGPPSDGPKESASSSPPSTNSSCSIPNGSVLQSAGTQRSVPAWMMGAVALYVVMRRRRGVL